MEITVVILILASPTLEQTKRKISSYMLRWVVTLLCSKLANFFVGLVCELRGRYEAWAWCPCVFFFLGRESAFAIFFGCNVDQGRIGFNVSLWVCR